MKNIITLLWLSILCTACSFEYTHEFTQEDLQQQINAKMPITKEKSILTLTVYSADISLLSISNEVGLKAHMEISTQALIRYKTTGHIQLVGGIRYEPASYSFYLQNPKVLDFHIDKLPERQMATVKQIATVAIEQFLLSQPIAQLKDDKTKQKIAKAILKSVSVQEDKLVAVLGSP